MTTNTDVWQKIRRQLELRLIFPHEKDLWKELMQLHHYLGFGRIVGESLCYVANINGQWLALKALSGNKFGFVWGCLR